VATTRTREKHCAPPALNGGEKGKNMDYTQIIVALLPIFAQAAPQLVADIAKLIHGNPQAQDESDAAYIARIGAMVDQNVTDVKAADAEIQK
jgi:hypothetical protein